MEKLNIWQRALLHGFLLWLVINANDAAIYWYNIQTDGYFIVNADGTPVTQWQRFLNHNYHQLVWIPILAISCWAELTHHFLFMRKPFRSYLILLLAGSGILAILNQTWNWLAHGSPFSSGIGEVYLALVAYSLLYSFTRYYFHKKREAQKEELYKSKAEIKALKAQINPHFFFNTLNVAYGTALQENAPRTVDCIEQLSEMMHYSMAEAEKDYTLVSNEINFIQKYIQLQELRLPKQENIRIEVKIISEDHQAKIAPLLLIPFVENAFKYGISLTEPCLVRIDLKSADGHLELLIENSRFPAKDHVPGFGTGITNARQRLEILYPGKHRISCGPEGLKYIVSLHINLN